MSEKDLEGKKVLGTKESIYQKCVSILKFYSINNNKNKQSNCVK